MASSRLASYSLVAAFCAFESDASSFELSVASSNWNSTITTAIIGMTTMTAKNRRNRPRKEGWSRVMASGSRRPAH